MFYHSDQFACARLLESGWRTIRAELDRLLGEDHFTLWYEDDLHNRRWEVFGFFDGYQKPERITITENCERCPETARLLEGLPGLLTAGFSLMQPGAYIRPHVGTDHSVYRCHLGLIIPENCGMIVGGRRVTWTEGRCMVFDDTYIHEAWNFSRKPRVVLLIDFKKSAYPQVSPSPPTSLETFYSKIQLAQMLFYDKSGLSSLSLPARILRQRFLSPRERTPP